MAGFKHLSLSDRILIESMLGQSQRLSAIAHNLKRDRHTIAREIMANRTLIPCGSYSSGINNCTHRKGCQRTGLCTNCTSRRGRCTLCGRCNKLCPDFRPQTCPRLERAPFCCNGCQIQRNCALTRYRYAAEKAQTAARERLKAVRSGITLTVAELEHTDQLLSPLIRKGQSIHHIYLTHRDEFFCSERTVYTLIDQGCLTARNLDLARKVRRKMSPKRSPFKVDRACRRNRTFLDYQQFLGDHPGLVATQMDSVLGTVESHKVLLTLFLPQAQFLLGYIRDYNTARSVREIFDHLELILGSADFFRLFPVLLTDNGTEFSDPQSLELHGQTRLFYCDPLQSNQKAQIERAHEFIRMVRPKGSSFDDLNQADIDRLCSHINNYRRDSLGGRSPFEAFAFLYGEDILHKLNIWKLNADEVTLTPRLLPVRK